MGITIESTSVYLPDNVLSNSDLEQKFPSTSEHEILKNTGIKQRYISGEKELASDMAVKAAKKNFEETGFVSTDFDFLIFCSEGFDYIAPASSCIIHDKLSMRKDVGCIDLPYGCSGFVYGLGIAYGLLSCGIAKKVLFLTADIPSKGIATNDIELKSLFSDIATANILSLNESKQANKFLFGTDGSGALDLYIENSAYRSPIDANYIMPKELRNGQMIMNGTNVFLFAIKEVPKLIENVLSSYGYTKNDIDLFVLHQASFYILEVLRKKIGVPAEKFFVNIDEYGNSVSSSIPLALFDAQQKGKIKAGMKVLVAGYGIGYSWAATVIEY